MIPLPLRLIVSSTVFVAGLVAGILLRGHFGAPCPAPTPAETTTVQEPPRVVTVTKTVEGDCRVTETEPSPVTITRTQFVDVPGPGRAAEQSQFSIGADYPLLQGRGTPHVDASVRLGGTPASAVLGAGLDGSASVGLRWDLQ